MTLSDKDLPFRCWLVVSHWVSFDVYTSPSGKATCMDSDSPNCCIILSQWCIFVVFSSEFWLRTHFFSIPHTPPFSFDTFQAVTKANLGEEGCKERS